jgi:hypothetical protein
MQSLKRGHKLFGQRSGYYYCLVLAKPFLVC